MLALRLARGAHPLVLLRRLLVAGASAGVGLLLLCTLGYAAGHPQEAAGSAARLLWCAVPLATAVQLAIAVARTDPAARPQPGLASAGLGPVMTALLAAVSTAVSCTFGSVLALLVFLHLRGDFGGTLPYTGAAAGLLGAREPLPFAAVVTLLAVVPATAGAAAAIAMRPRPEQSATGAPSAPASAPPVATALPWGIALTAAGLALGAYARRVAPLTSSEGLVPLPGRLDTLPPGVIAGWALIATGLVLGCPGLTHLCGRALSAGRPSALRLLSGRVLQEEAQRIGRPLGVLCAVAAAAVTALRLYGTGLDGTGTPPFGPFTGFGAALVLACATATVCTAALEAKTARQETTLALLRAGTPTVLLRQAAALRAAVLVAVLAPVTWTVAQLAASPLQY